MPSDTVVTVYMRPGCHLCADATSLLRRFGLSVAEINIDLSPELRGRYDDRVPVLVLEGRELLWGIIREEDIRRAFGLPSAGRTSGY